MCLSYSYSYHFQASKLPLKLPTAFLTGLLTVVISLLAKLSSNQHPPTPQTKNYVFEGWEQRKRKNCLVCKLGNDNPVVGN